MNSKAITLLRDGLRQAVSALDELLDQDEWIDQHESPLGRRHHCEAARSGKLRAKKVRGQWLARRADIDAYIEAHGKRAPAEREGADDAKIVADILQFRAPRRRPRK